MYAFVYVYMYMCLYKHPTCMYCNALQCNVQAKEKVMPKSCLRCFSARHRCFVMYACIYVCLYMYVYICIYICIYTHVYIYI